MLFQYIAHYVVCLNKLFNHGSFAASRRAKDKANVLIRLEERSNSVKDTPHQWVYLKMTWILTYKCFNLLGGFIKS